MMLANCKPPKLKDLFNTLPDKLIADLQNSLRSQLPLPNVLLAMDYVLTKIRNFPSTMSSLTLSQSKPSSPQSDLLLLTIS